ncbi:unnamed protein product [Amaranthus hypochondriacus]
MLHKSFKPAKCKTSLNLAKSRIKLMKNKKEIQLKQMKRDLAQLLESGQDQTARIRVEHVVREEKTMAAYEMIEIYCELIVARLPIIESQKNCPLDLKEAIASLIFAAPRCADIAELQDVRKQFTAKYGKDFANAASEVRPNCGVSRTLVEKLSVNAPDGPTKVKILTAIAEEHNVKWEPNWIKEDPVPTVDIPVAATHNLEGNMIQMQPLKFEIADDVEEKHAYDTGRPGTSQSYIHNLNDLGPPSSISHLEPRRSESTSEKMVLSQSSMNAESSFNNGRQNRNMEFKDATAAAQAAAESAELASIAARAAAELSMRSNVTSASSRESIPSLHGQTEDNVHSAGSGLQQSHVHRNSTSGSFNQRSPRMQSQVEANRQNNMREDGETTRLNKDYTRFKEQCEAGTKDFTNRKSSIRYARDSDSESSPILSKTEPNTFRSSTLQESEIESSENPFYEETPERENQRSSLQSEKSTFGDEYHVFANVNYDTYKFDSGDESAGTFSRTAIEEDWYAPSAHAYGEEDMAFKNHSEGKRVLESDDKNAFNSRKDPFAVMDHGTSGKDKDYEEKGFPTHEEVVFDESSSDNDDDVRVLNPADEHDVSSPSNFTSKGSFFNKDNIYYEPDISKSFRSSSIYSKLIEPVTFDDSDGASSGSEKDQHRKKTDFRKPNTDSFELKSSFVEESDDSFKTTKHVENQRRYPGLISKQKSGIDDSDASHPSYDDISSTAVSSDLRSRPDYYLSDEGEPQKSLQSSRVSESNHDSELETQNKSGGGMELNLGSLPAGRRNKTQWRMRRGGLAHASSASKSIAAASSDSFDSSKKPSIFDSPSQTDNKQTQLKKSERYTQYDSPGDDLEVTSTLNDSNDAEGPYGGIVHGNLRRSTLKDPTGFFDSDDSGPEENVPKPVAIKTLGGAGISRRTKTSTPRSAVSARTSSVAAKTGQSSHSFTNEVSSYFVDQSNSNDDGGSATSRDDKSIYSSIAEKPINPKRPDAMEETNLNEKNLKETSAKLPSHVHPKLPDFEAFTAHLQSLRKNRQ